MEIVSERLQFFCWGRGEDWFGAAKVSEPVEVTLRWCSGELDAVIIVVRFIPAAIRPRYIKMAHTAPILRCPTLFQSAPVVNGILPNPLDVVLRYRHQREAVGVGFAADLAADIKRSFSYASARERRPVQKVHACGIRYRQGSASRRPSDSPDPGVLAVPGTERFEQWRQCDR